MMDDIAEQQDVAKEISDAISNPVSFGMCFERSILNSVSFSSTYTCFWIGQDIDEDELNRELEELEQEELDKELIGVGPSTEELPEVPTGEIREPAAASEKKKGALLNEPTLLNCRTIT